MADKKRKFRDEPKQRDLKRDKKPKQSKKFSKKNKKDQETRKRTGPRLPSSLRKELDRLNAPLNSDDDEIDSDQGNDVYEYEEELPEEETRKNRRFDPVQNYEYELPEEFEVCFMFIYC